MSWQIEAWADGFPPGTDQLWQGIRLLARRVEEANDEDLPVATHSFLYSVGNFKRTTPIFPAALDTPAVPESWEALPELTLWEGMKISRNDAATWSQLESIYGIGIPTATTILAALWPSEHAVFDRLTVQAAVGLRGAGGLGWACAA